MKFPGGLGQILEQAQKLQQNVQQLQAEMEKRIVEGSAGGGLVTVSITGALQVVSLTIDSSLGNDLAMIQDLVQAAMNDGLRKAKEMLKEEMAKVAPFPIPGLS